MPFYTKVLTDPDGVQENVISEDEAAESGAESTFEDYVVPHESADDISAVKRLMDEENGKDWIEKFHIFGTGSIEADVNDDTQRELAFETAALNSVAKAVQMFKKIKYQYRRPDDYFVEMQKSDTQMHRVRGLLERQRQQLQDKEERRKRKYMKKIGKHTEAQILQERQKKKKDMLRKVEEFKRNSKRGRPTEELDFSDEDGEDGGKSGGGPGAKKRRRGPNPTSGRKNHRAKTKRHGKAKRQAGRGKGSKH
eukprot:TRINITY_DN5265_c0_g1_i1.p2 TRINITY_DN5265_c0_g1~~TRINITY_DN5265_c0_g1_i1.p2  ORF type:complete len:259 (-),score=123.65 TRINITY_DN5265_c0_g1_i1:174-929(-)